MQELTQKKKKLIGFLLENNILVEPEFLEELNAAKEQSEILELINDKISSAQITKTSTEKLENKGNVKIIFSFDEEPKKITAQNFINHFNARYNVIKKILQNRAQLENVSSINRLKGKSEREIVSIIGAIFTKEDTKNGIMMTIEDPTGSIKVFVNKNRDLFSKAKDAVLDEVIGVSGSLGKGIIFANDLLFPDIPLTKELKKSPIEEYAIFLADIHIGSKQFLQEEFMKFINWINGRVGNEKQREIASKVKYLFITGDAVDGISVYPTQKEDLDITTYKGQYQKLSEYLKMIPEHIKIIITPGNHDVVHLAEPQPPLPKEYCKELWEMPNVILVSNPSIVNIGATESFQGFDVLLYHGYSYNYYADNVESIRIQKPNISERADLVMKFLLQKRHMAPTYDANPHSPTEIDHMIIDKIPDIFVSGDVHRSAVFNYRGVITGIISGCFQSRTSFQEKVGHVPDPGRVPIVNLKTRDVKILNFKDSKEDAQKND